MFGGQSLYGIADYDNPAANNVLVEISSSDNDNYYITFNRRAGINSRTRNAINLVTITRSTFENGYQSGASASDLVAKLGSGDKFSVKIDCKNMVVQVDEIGISSARVIISENGLGCCHCSCSSKSAKVLVSSFVKIFPL